ncbi:MAG: 50S ribosomal protein L10 [Bacteroidales bacterium]|jgi:large subunit ribosomal protein L10|nr:50S ribosomal protein L10 [Bacteroidales bacterium]MDD4214645.1 50S ribosomal protein L10 [Bacteroidales bacterium]
MKKDEKEQVIEVLSQQLKAANNFYITDISDLNVEKTNELRRLCFKRNIKLTVVKNTLLKKAMEKTERDFEELYPVLKGGTSIMVCEAANVPAKLIAEFRKTFKMEKPVLKAAFIEESTYIGNDQLSLLVALKSKNELIGEIIGLLQSPVRNVIGALQSGGQTISGIVKTLSEKPE